MRKDDNQPASSTTLCKQRVHSGVESFSPMTATLRKTFHVPFPENGTGDIQIHSLLVTNNNKLVIAQGGIDMNKLKVVSLDNVDEVKEIELGLMRVPFDMALQGDGLVAVSCRNLNTDILLVDVSGADPVISKTVPPPRQYVETAVAGGTGDELIVAGWTLSNKGYVDVLSRQGEVIRNIKENWDKVFPEHVVQNGNDLFISATDLNNYQPLLRVDLVTGKSIPTIGTLDLSNITVDTFFQGDVDSAGNLYFPVNGGTCFNGADEAPSAHCVLVIAPDGQIRVLLYGINFYRMATAVAATPTGIAVAWQIEPYGPGSTYHVAVEGYEFA